MTSGTCDVDSTHAGARSENQGTRAPDGRDNAEVLGEVIDSYVEELGRINATLDRRYHEITRGQVDSINGDEVFERLCRKSEERRAARE